jgi:hypothetical protein
VLAAVKDAAVGRTKSAISARQLEETVRRLVVEANASGDLPQL